MCSPYKLLFAFALPKRISDSDGVREPAVKVELLDVAFQVRKAQIKVRLSA